MISPGRRVMDSVVRGALTYAFVWLIFRVSGKRTLAEMTTFDFVLLLIISETTQGALMSNDASMTNAFLLIITMIGMDIGLSLIKQRFPAVEHAMDGSPLLLIANGRMFKDRMEKERVDEDDILASARLNYGIDSLDDIRHAVLERDGGISVIPRKQ
jgi:uncharacterized membrane protein YcaP (DUF421 family)